MSCLFGLLRIEKELAKIITNPATCFLFAYILLLRFLYKKSFSIVTELHVQVDRLSIHFNVDLHKK